MLDMKYEICCVKKIKRYKGYKVKNFLSLPHTSRKCFAISKPLGQTHTVTLAVSYPVRKPSNIHTYTSSPLICHHHTLLLHTLMFLVCFQLSTIFFPFFFVFSCMYVKGLHIHLIFRPFSTLPVLCSLSSCTS